MVVLRATRSPGLTAYLLSNLGRKTALSHKSGRKIPGKILIAYILILESIPVALWMEYFYWSGLGHVSAMVRGNRSATAKLLRRGSPLEKGLVIGRRKDECWKAKIIAAHSNGILGIQRGNFTRAVSFRLWFQGLLIRNSGGGASNLCFNKSTRWFWCRIKFENPWKGGFLHGLRKCSGASN